MAKLVKLDPHYWPSYDVGYWCPGCGYMHEISVFKPNHRGVQWGFDGNTQCPTFTPSINYQVNVPSMAEYQPDISSHVCHHFVRAGKIIFCGDSTHGLVNQTVDLPDFPVDKHLSCERI